MFRGQFEHTIDVKGRTSLPAHFRRVLEAGDRRLVVTKALVEPCLDVYPMSTWEELETKVAKLPRWDRDAVLLRRRYLSRAAECDLDKHGRILIPGPLRDSAHLDKQVVWAGVGNNLELWAPDRLEDSIAMSDEELDVWAQNISKKLEL